MPARSPGRDSERAWFDSLYVLLFLIQALHIVEQWLTNTQLLESQGLGPWLSRVLVFLAAASLPIWYRWFIREFPVVFITIYAAGHTIHGSLHAYSALSKWEYEPGIASGASPLIVGGVLLCLGIRQLRRTMPS